MTTMIPDLFQGNDYIVTADSDMWPIDPRPYIITKGKDILVLNTFCCGQFQYKYPGNDTAKTYRMYPLSNVGASAKVWRELMFAQGLSSNTVGEVLQYTRHYFGEGKVVLGNDRWYTDQKLVSLKIYEYERKHGKGPIDLRRRSVRRDRLRRSDWRPSSINFNQLTDAHVIHDMFKQKKFSLTKPVLTKMYPAEAVDYLARYTDTFRNSL